MNYDSRLVRGIRVIALEGELNSLTSSDAYDEITKSIQPNERVLLDMSNVRFMSSAGIRTLLLLYRTIHDSKGEIVVVGLSDDLRETLELTGFLEYFNTKETVDAGMTALRSI